MVGMTVPLFLCTILLFSMYESTIGSTPDFLHAVPVFRATGEFALWCLINKRLGLPLLFIWCWSLLIIAWQKTTINYVYIMQLDTSTIASYLSILKVNLYYEAVLKLRLRRSSL